MKKIILSLFMLAMAGCVDYVPECDAPEVENVLSEMLDGVGARLVENLGATTTLADENVRMCKSEIKFQFHGTTNIYDTTIAYEVRLSDKGDRFWVELKDFDLLKLLFQ